MTGPLGAPPLEVLVDAVGELVMADTKVPNGKASDRADLSAVVLEKIPVLGSVRAAEIVAALLASLAVIVDVISTEPAAISIVTAERATAAASATTCRMAV